MAQNPNAPSRDAVIDALMRLAESRPWSDIELQDIAQEAGISLADLRDMFPSKGAILGGLSRRLDPLAPYKRALKRISQGMRGDPLSLAAMNQMALNSQRYMLAAAGISTEDALGFLKLQGAVIIHANTLETWFDDDDPALARTMARLDREIRRGERVME